MVQLRRLASADGRRPGPTDSVFVIADMSSQREQQERLWWLVKRGRKTLLIVAAVTFVALVAIAGRGTFNPSSWLLPVVALILAGSCHVIDRYLEAHPPGSVEVPEDLGDVLDEMHQVRDEIVIYGPDRFRPLQYERAVELVDGQVAAMIQDAAGALVAQRQGDQETATALRATIDSRLEAVMDVYDALDEDADDADDQDDSDADDDGRRGQRPPDLRQRERR